MNLLHKERSRACLRPVFRHTSSPLPQQKQNLLHNAFVAYTQQVLSIYFSISYGKDTIFFQINFAMSEKVSNFAPDFKIRMVGVAQLVRVPDCGSEGRGFEPHLPPPQKKNESRTTRPAFFAFSSILNNSFSPNWPQRHVPLYQNGTFHHFLLPLLYPYP